MTTVGWLADVGNQDGTPGGAELTQAEFRAAAPEGVEVVDCPPGNEEDCDRYVIHNCVTYSLEDLWKTEMVPTVKYWHDVGPHVASDVRDHLERNVRQICCSPLQAEYMGLSDARLIPPAVDLQPFREAAGRANGRTGAVSVAAWANPGKAPHRVHELAPDADFYGGGPFAPQGSSPVAYNQLPALLARYATFIFLPDVLEPFGRTVVEAHAAGCRVVTNRLVGARHWLENEPQALESAAEDFWQVVLE